MSVLSKKFTIEIPSFETCRIQLPPFVQRGNPFDKYEIVTQIGKGAFGSVVKVKLPNNTFKAIKILNVSKRSDSCSIQKGLKEAENGMMIDHPNIVKTHELFYDGYNFFFVMDLVSPILVSSIPDSVKEKLLLFQQLISVVSQLYSLGFLHRDIKLENTGIRTGEDGKQNLVLFDLGEACKVSDFYKEFVGTILNMSPEVVVNCQYSDRSEVWALICYLIELLTGKSLILELFDKAQSCISALQVQIKISSLLEPPIPSGFKEDSSPSGLLMLHILEKGLAIDPEDRLTLPQLEHSLQELIDLL
jgi:serine/threonine protein kinase